MIHDSQQRQVKGLVVGGGSIGKRHLTNLITLGVKLALVESDSERRALVAAEFKVPAFSSIDEGLEWGPTFAVLATPTHLHLEQALVAAGGGLDLFIEKPLSHTPEGLFDLLQEVERRKLVSLVGCNMRFHPGPARVKELLEARSLGRVLFARIHAGSYLPDWRPGTDYRTNYAAQSETGGGCLLDCIHEIDLARWYLGEVQEVFCIAEHISSLEINTEDLAILVCRHQGGVWSEIHLDYVQRTYERGCQIVGERGSVFWDFTGRQVRWYDAATKSWSCFAEPENWQLNQMYLDEMRHFIDCIEARKQTVLPVTDAARIMQVVFAARASARDGRPVSTTREVLA